jgi:chromosome segregation ATPase
MCIDGPVHRALKIADMSEFQILRAELERMEASIAEIRKQELDVDDRLAEVQTEKDDLVTQRAALEEAANLIRQRLGRPASSIVVQLQTSRPARPQPAAVVPRRTIRQGTKRDQFLAVIKPLFENDERSARRQAIKQAALDAGLFEDAQNIESTVSTNLTHLKAAGYITTDHRGTWTWTGIR